MKKPLIFLIASLAFVVAGGVLAFLYTATPKNDQSGQSSKVAATAEQKCGTKLKELYKTVYSVMLSTCVTAYKLEATSKNGAADFCQNQSGNSNVNATVMTSVCGTGQRIAVAESAAASRPAPSPRPPSPSPGGQASLTAAQGPARPASAANPQEEVVDPPDNVSCGTGANKDKGVRLGTKGLGDRCIGDKNQNPIYALITTVAKYLIGLLGLIFVFIVVISGFQYVVSRGNPDETKAAKQRLEHAVTGIILLVLMTAILNLIIPGGVL